MSSLLALPLRNSYGNDNRTLDVPTYKDISQTSVSKAIGIFGSVRFEVVFNFVLVLVVFIPSVD